MKKEDILQASRNENQNKDFYELEITRKGQRIGGLIGLSIAFALMVIERVVLENDTNYGYFCIIMATALGLFTYKAITGYSHIDSLCYYDGLCYCNANTELSGLMPWTIN